jgi:hypothetical protein
MTLEIISDGLYQLEILFNTDRYDDIKKYRWCFEASKGLVYCMDLTMELPKRMGYKTPRVYLRDYLVFLEGLWKDNKPTVIWKRNDLTNYVFHIDNTRPVLALV